MVKLNELKDALESQGWTVDHVSTHEGQPSSYYLTRRADTLAHLRGQGPRAREIRISNHELTSKNGERQGQCWTVNIVINGGLSLEDHLATVENEDYGNGCDGFSQGYSYREWQDDQAA
ncbi:MAG TPA: hypothetical protein VFX37_09765 [Pseudolabrys sp.]|nr:hypothetical protein [Pseudolabrys sp.]